MGNLGAPEIILIILFILIFFGAKKIPEIAQGLGKGIREFKKATRDIQDDIERGIKPEDSPARPVGTLEQTKCHSCGSTVARNTRFCPTCGASLEQVKCAKCSTFNPPSNKFCSSCGEKLAA